MRVVPCCAMLCCSGGAVCLLCRCARTCVCMRAELLSPFHARPCCCAPCANARCCPPHSPVSAARRPRCRSATWALFRTCLPELAHTCPHVRCALFPLEHPPTPSLTAARPPADPVLPAVPSAASLLSSRENPTTLLCLLVLEAGRCCGWDCCCWPLASRLPPLAYCPGLHALRLARRLVFPCRVYARASSIACGG